MRRLLLTILAALLWPATSAQAASAPAWDGVSARISASMQELQQPDGSLSEYLAGVAQPYAEAMVGYGLMLRGVRTGDRSLVDAGLRAVGQTVDPDKRYGPGLDSVFKQLAVASAYNLGSQRLAGDPAFEAQRSAWAAWLQRVRPVLLTSLTRGASNKHLVEAIADLELLRSGIPAGEAGTVLADPDGVQARVRALVADRWPAIVRDQSRPGPLGAMAVASDAPTHPLAYHGLSLGMYDRAIELLGPSAGSGARTALRRMARASWTLAAPDGDLAYWGRSQEQSWALALTAAGADALDPRAAAALRSRLAGRVIDVHGFGPYGVWIVPALRADAAAGRSAMDDYAANGVYNGLTLVGAEWTLADLAAGDDHPVGSLAADGSRGWVLGHGLASFAVAREGSVWYAVRMRGGFGAHGGDPRYAFGLMAAKRRTNGRWHDQVPPAPRGAAAGDGPGPYLVLRGGRLAEPYGRRMRVTRSGVVVVRGGFRTAAGRPVRRHVRFTYAPTARGVRLSFRVRTGDRVEVAEFRRQAPARGIDVAIAPRPGRTGAVRVTSGLASATLGTVVRLGVRIRATRAGTLHWTPR